MRTTTRLRSTPAADAACDGRLTFDVSLPADYPHLASALSHRTRFEDRQTPVPESERPKNVRSTTSNITCRCDSLARRSGVSRVGRRGLPLPPSSTVQPRGIYRQCWISCLPMCPSASDLPRPSWPSGTEGSHWHDRSRWKGRCIGTDWACRRRRHRRADGPLRTCGAERNRGPQWCDRRDGIRRTSRTHGRYGTKWSVRSHRTLRCNGRDRHQWNTGGSRTRRRDWPNGIHRHQWSTRSHRTRRCDRGHRHQRNHGVHWTCRRHRVRRANRTARPRRV
jgi:hypothetical protein